MHPAPSIIIFTTLSGAGFGMLAWLALGAVPVGGMPALLFWGMGYALAIGGLVASTFHLGNPQRALLAFTQWRTSWLSREAWASAMTLVILAPVALAAILGIRVPVVIGVIGALMCIATVVTTGMIYAQMKTVPRWNTWMTPVQFVLFSLTGGAILSLQLSDAVVLCVLLATALVAVYAMGDARVREVFPSTQSAIGSGRNVETRALFAPHSGPNYVMKEMIHVVGRKHSRRLRVLSVLLAAIIPALLMLFAPGQDILPIVAVLHLTGALAARWLFFAEAEHVVGLYYGAGPGTTRN
ncbi:DMSO reductase anchor subunit [Albidovulum inexpectatum]|uniref:DMSO reductase anchor subunit n=1 Tax=Albidovulum inexpectatum TaxID=196587 RepID=A0A2S5JF67_9RHOB|nr:DmsC/YnfH family molybdoenzyme membrane anchor subunit [Albidovulum inexpectatum]PPB80070.1 DMSO reductase anchor subunit [Albidovulum inexpectatum]